MRVNGTGINPGRLNLGEGTVILAQRTDSYGNVQDLNEISTVGGRPTIVLSNNQQVNPDHIKWAITAVSSILTKLIPRRRLPTFGMDTGMNTQGSFTQQNGRLFI